jgi:DNA-binding transcriptional regulator YhcF (GntR family)
MASRRQVEERRAALKDDLRRDCRDGVLEAGRMAPSVRELAQKYELSVNVAHQSLRQLIDEGVLYAVRGVGTFAGQRAQAPEFYLLLSDVEDVEPKDSEHVGALPGSGALLDPIQPGFEERIATLGGASLALPRRVAREQARRGALPPLAGVYGGIPDPDFKPNLESEPASTSSTNAVAHAGRVGYVAFRGHVPPGARHRFDVVSFDDYDGGRQAARHLISLGHRSVAFIGLHAPHSESASELFAWSDERERGWRDEMEVCGGDTRSLVFGPREEPPVDYATWVRVGEQAGRDFLSRTLGRRLPVTGIVAANDHVALGLLEALRAARIPAALWPAVVGFDNLPDARGQILSSLHQPSENIGRAAADLLWNRRHGLLQGPPVHHKVPMRLLGRLSSRVGWPALMPLAPAIAPAGSC